MKKAKRKIFTLAMVLMGVWIASPVSSARASEREATLEIIRAAITEVRKESIKRLTSPHAAQAYLNFAKISSSPTFINTTKTQTAGCKERSCTDEQVKAYFHAHISKKLVKAIKDIPVIFNENEFSDDAFNTFRSNIWIGGLYYPRTNIIYINPESFEKTKQVYSKIITVTIREEFEHAIDRNLTYGDLFPKSYNPHNSDKYALSKILYGIFSHEIIQGDPSGSGGYVTEPREFYAKIQVIKTVLRQKHPEFFDTNGNIHTKKLTILLHAPWLFISEHEADLRVLETLNKSKVKEIQRFINQLV